MVQLLADLRTTLGAPGSLGHFDGSAFSAQLPADGFAGHSGASMCVSEAGGGQTRVEQGAVDTGGGRVMDFIG